MFSNELVCDIITYINTNINDEITIDSLSNKFYFNRTYIMKRFKKELGISIVNYINILRIYNSLKYLKEDKKILEIALLNGFNSQEYYTEIFRNVIGVNPLKYKKYINYITKLDDKSINIIESNIISIESILNNIDKYMNNRKPTITVKKLSLFK
jgi:AraC-like DNA-binding protein